MTDDYAQRRQRIFKFCTLPKFENFFLSPCSAVCFTQHLPYPHPLTSHTPVSHQILSIGMSFYRRSRTTVYVCPVRTLFIGQTGDIAQFLRWIAVSMDKLLNIASLSSCVISSRSASHNAFSGTKQSRHPLVHHSAFSCTNHCPRPRWYPRNPFSVPTAVPCPFGTSGTPFLHETLTMSKQLSCVPT